MSARNSLGGTPLASKRRRPSATDFYDQPPSPLRVDSNFAQQPQSQHRGSPLSVTASTNAAMRYSDRQQSPRGPHGYRDDNGGSSGYSSPYARRTDTSSGLRRRSRSPGRFEERDRRSDYRREQERREQERVSRVLPRQRADSRSPIRGGDLKTREFSTRNSISYDNPPTRKEQPKPKSPVSSSQNSIPLRDPAQSPVSAQVPPSTDEAKGEDAIQTQLVNDVVKGLTDIMFRLTEQSTEQASLALEQRTAEKWLQQCRGELTKSESVHTAFPSSVAHQKASVQRAEKTVKDLSERLKLNKAKVTRIVGSFATKVISVKLGKDDVAQEKLRGRCDALEKTCANLKAEKDLLSAKSEELETKYKVQQETIQAMLGTSARTDEEALGKIRLEVTQLQSKLQEPREVVSHDSLREALAPMNKRLEDLVTEQGTTSNSVAEVAELKKRLEDLGTVPRQIDDLRNHIRELPNLKKQLDEIKKDMGSFSASLALLSDDRSLISVQQQTQQLQELVTRQKQNLEELDRSVRGQNNAASLHRMILQSANEQGQFRDSISAIEGRLIELETDSIGKDNTNHSQSEAPVGSTPHVAETNARLDILTQEVQDKASEASADKEMLFEKIEETVAEFKAEIKALKKQANSGRPTPSADAASTALTTHIRHYEEYIDGQKRKIEELQGKVEFMLNLMESVDRNINDLKENSHNQAFPEVQNLQDRFGTLVNSQNLVDERLTEAESRIDAAINGITTLSSRFDSLHTADLARHILAQLSDKYPHTANASEGIARISKELQEFQKRLTEEVSGLRGKLNDVATKPQESIGIPRLISEARSSEFDSMVTELHTKGSAFEPKQTKAENRVKSLRQEMDSLVEKQMNLEKNHKALENLVMRDIQSLRNDLKRKAVNGAAISVKRLKSSHNTGFINEDSEEDADPQVHLGEDSD